MENPGNIIDLCLLRWAAQHKQLQLSSLCPGLPSDQSSIAEGAVAECEMPDEMCKCILWWAVLAAWGQSWDSLS